MNLSSLFVVFKDFKSRKFSSFLTFFAISLGILSIFVIIIISIGFQNSINAQFEKVGTNLLSIQPEGASTTDYSKKGLTTNDAVLLESRPYIISTFPHYMKKVQLMYNNEYKSAMVLGIYNTKDYFDDFSLDLDLGRFPKSNEKYALVIGSKTAKEVFKKDVRVGSNIYIKNIKFKVVGILKSVGNPQDDKNIYANIKTMQDLYNEKDVVHMIYARVESNYDVNLAAKNSEIFLENRHGKDTIKVSTFEQIISSFKNILSIIQLTLGGIAFISLIVGALGIINTMFVIITEKTKEIGIFKAIGARNSDILFIYIFQSGMYGFLGGILGVFFGSFVALGFGVWAKTAGYDFLVISIDYMIIIYLLLFSLFIGVLAGFLPSYKASKLKIVDTFRM